MQRPRKAEKNEALKTSGGPTSPPANYVGHGGPPPTLGLSCVIEVRVVPRSSKITISRQAPAQYKIKLTSPPVDGAANKQLIQVLAQHLSIAPRNIEIISGAKSVTKRLRIEGIAQHQLDSILAAP